MEIWLGWELQSVSYSTAKKWGSDWSKVMVPIRLVWHPRESWLHSNDFLLQISAYSMTNRWRFCPHKPGGREEGDKSPGGKDKQEATWRKTGIENESRKEKYKTCHLA